MNLGLEGVGQHPPGVASGLLAAAEEGAEYAADEVLAGLRGQDPACGADAGVDHAVALTSGGRIGLPLGCPGPLGITLGAGHLASLLLDGAALLGGRHHAAPGGSQSRETGGGSR